MRDAIHRANTLGGLDVIEFSPDVIGSTIRLVSGELLISDALLIRGPGRRELAVDAGATSRIIRIAASAQEVAMTGLTLSGGASQGSGGAVLADNAMLTIRDAILSGNTAEGTRARGGAVATQGTLYVESTIIEQNHTRGFNSGCGGVDAGQLTLVTSRVLQNSTEQGPGGGLCGGIVEIRSSTISGNTTHGDAGWGGGVYARSLLVFDSTVSGNRTYGYYSVGGGLFAWDDATIMQSTISANETEGRYAHGAGAGSYGTLSIQHSTITGNRLAGGLGSLGGGTFGQSLELAHTIVAGNESRYASLTYAQDLYFQNAHLDFSLVGSNRSTNLSEAPVGAPDPSGNLIGDADGQGTIHPRLAPLADHGGPTRTHALLPDSPAVDAGDPNARAGVHGVPAFDQRGTPYQRVTDGNMDGTIRIDIGALERQAVFAVDGDFNDDGRYNCLDIDALTAEIVSGRHDPAFDLTGDGAVNREDLDAWLVEGGANNPGQTAGHPFVAGDANLDGVVDGSDFNTWNTHKFAILPAWCAGDFDANGFVDGSDFNIWNTYKFTSSIPFADRAGIPPIAACGLDQRIVAAHAIDREVESDDTTVLLHSQSGAPARLSAECRCDDHRASLDSLVPWSRLHAGHFRGR